MSAEIRFTCPTCKAGMAAPVERAGEKINCLKCGQRLQIPPVERAKTVLAPMMEIVDVPVPPQTGEQTQVASGPAPVVPGSLSSTSPLGDAPSVHRQQPPVDALERIRTLALAALFSDWRRLPTCPLMWPCFFLFFLPWVNISCMGPDGKGVHMLSQSGFQSCYGGVSLDQKLDRMVAAERHAQPQNKEERPPWSALSIMYGVLIVLAGSLGLACIVLVFLKTPTACGIVHILSLSLGGLAFALLSLQTLIHFPIEREYDRRLVEQREMARRGGGFGGPQLGAMIEFKYSIWLWLSVIISSFSIPIFALEAALSLYQIIGSESPVGRTARAPPLTEDSSPHHD